MVCPAPGGTTRTHRHATEPPSSGAAPTPGSPASIPWAPVSHRHVRFVYKTARPVACCGGPMTKPDMDAAAQYLAANARVLERRRFERLFAGWRPGPVRDAVAAYRNADGGFGHALEPDSAARAASRWPSRSR